MTAILSINFANYFTAETLAETYNKYACSSLVGFIWKVVPQIKKLQVLKWKYLIVP